MAGSDDPKFLKKHLRTTNIDVHPREQALVVTYEMEATILGQFGDAMAGERKHLQKIIRLQELSKATDTAALARQVVDRCALIPEKRLPEVQQLIYYLQKRQGTDSGQGSAGQTGATGRDQLSTNFGFDHEITERASVNKLDAYIEMLYEDLPEKVRGTALVLQLARNPDNLEQLMENETLIGALARVLREECKKNFDLAINISYTFFCFSTFSNFHHMISHFKVGALCLSIIETEHVRFQRWSDELRKTSSKNAKEKAASQKNFEQLVVKQSQLLRVCIYLLLNLSEDLKVEMKMVNRGIIELLIGVLNRAQPELLVLTLTFLRKLSVYKENVAKMHECKLITKVASLYPPKDSDTEVALAGARLLYNLSFCSDCRGSLVTSGIVQHLVPLSDNEEAQDAVLSLLYNLSMEEECKSLLTYTDCIQICMRVLLSDESHYLSKCLLINLALECRNAQLIAGDTGQGLHIIMSRATELKDVLTMKLLKNIAFHAHPAITPYFVNFVDELALIVSEGCSKSKDKEYLFASECLGVLNQIVHVDINWTDVFKDASLNDWVKKCLSSQNVSDDLLLEVIILLGCVAASNQSGAQHVIDCEFVDPLITLLGAKQEDDEIVLQIVYVFYQILLYSHTRKIILTQTQIPAYLIDLMHDKNVQVRKLCDGTLEVIAVSLQIQLEQFIEHMEAGIEWTTKIAEERFRWHNAQWLEMVTDPDGVRPINDEGADRFALDESGSEADGPASAHLFGELYGMDENEEATDSDEDDRPAGRLERRESSLGER